MWFKKSRILWGEKGDKNFNSFHAMASFRQRKNFLDSFCINGVIVDDPCIMKQQVANHFQNHFKESWSCRAHFSTNFEVSVGEEESRDLVKLFSEEVIWEAVKDCDGNKAPGPDGFSLLAFKKGWKFLQHDML